MKFYINMGLCGGFGLQINKKDGDQSEGSIKNLNFNIWF